MTDSALVFNQLATRVLHRVVLRRWMALLHRTRWWALGAVAGAGALHLGAWPPALAVLLWFGVTAFFAWRQQPDRYSALALWDARRGESETFAAAWWFSQQTAPAAAERRHIEKQRQALQKSVPALARDLPLPWHRWLALVPLIALLGVALNVWHPPAMGDQKLTADMKQAARDEARKLATTTLTKEKLQGMNAEEQQAAEQLQRDVAKTSAELEQGAASSTHEVLGKLEQRAREAEKLAEQLRAGNDAWASPKMIDALRSHADTADLGDAIARRNAAQTASTATTIARELDAAQLPASTAARFTETLHDVDKLSEPEDRQRTAGSHILAAGDRLTERDPKQAAREFETLANKMRMQAQREETQRKLEALAQQLRDAGSRIAGNESGAMQKMSETAQAQPMQPIQATPTAQSMQQMMTSPSSPSPGQAQQGQPMLMQDPNAPPPGASNAQPAMVVQAPPPGQQNSSGQQNKDKSERPSLFAPVPGAKPEDQPGATLLSNQPPSEQAGSVAMAAPGGPKAGQGSSDPKGTATQQQKATQSSSVNAARSGDGLSTTRQVEGGVHEQQAAREATGSNVDFIRQQEAALDDLPLPAARREQVRRYFNELRKRFEPAAK